MMSGRRPTPDVDLGAAIRSEGEAEQWQLRASQLRDELLAGYDSL